MRANNAVKNVVLVHGPFADGSIWRKVISRLQEGGYYVTAVQLPLTSLKEDVAITRHIVSMQHGSVILVGHSYGGAVITEAGDEANVAGLVYIAAFAPDEGETLGDLIHRYATAPGFGHLRTDDHGFTWIVTEAFPQYFAGDIPDAEARVLAAVQHPWKVPGNRIVQPSWRSKPSWFQISEDDLMINPDLQRFLSQRMGAKTTSLVSSHAAMVSHPEETAQCIIEAAQSAQTKKSTRRTP
ncbi:alpha/beta hydrolase [Capsulimonas corticalis]|uniref:Alpha/beta hydrolase n=1 Tax=Capsulimonas corticalis TaxID=2219043 RepID=A0A402CVL7_9BACT|nr:alpha/beta hydrolase [Capsulimonas corticalis]BDI30450.1 alpha/beta hydrolase [Capsulimonas corticalis]